MKFEIGDVVVPKINGPEMVVRQLGYWNFEGLAPSEVSTTWFDKSLRQHNGTFPVDMLRLVERDPQRPGL